MKTSTILLMILIGLRLKSSAQCTAASVYEVIPQGGGVYLLNYELQDTTNYIVVDHWFYFPGSGGTGGNVWSFETEGWHPYHLTVYLADPADPENILCQVGMSDDIYIPCNLVSTVNAPGIVDPTQTFVTFYPGAQGGSPPYTFEFDSDNPYTVQNDGSVVVYFDGLSYASIEYRATDSQGCFSFWNAMAEFNSTLECTVSMDYTLLGQELYASFNLTYGENEIYYPVVLWEFGDGQEWMCYECPQNDAQLIHTYSSPGEYQVCITSLDDFEDSCPDTLCHTVQVDEPSITCPAIQDLSATYYGFDTYALNLITTDPSWDVTSVNWNCPSASPTFTNHFVFPNTGLHTICAEAWLDNPWTEEIEQCHDSLCVDVEILCVSYEVYIDSVIYNEQGTMVTVVPATNGGTAPFVYDWSTLDLPMIDQQGGASFEFGNDFVTAGMIGVTDANGCTGFTTDFYFDAPVISCELTAESQVSDSLLVVSFELFYNGIPVSEPLVIFNSGDGATLSSFPMNAYQNYFSYVYNNPGSYTWCLNTAEGQQGVCQVEVCSPIDIEDISGMVSIDDGDPFLVFPNPCKGFVSMEVQASDGIEIYDQQGKLVYQMGVVATGYLQLNLALSSGLYTIRCSRNHSVLQARLLVE